MSLEKTIEENTKAVLALTAALLNSAVPTKPAPISAPEKVAEAKKPQADPTLTSDTPTSPPFEKESPVATFDQVRVAILNVSHKSRATPDESRAQAEALLARFGTKKISGLKESQYADALSYAEKIMGGLDAEASGEAL